MDVRIRRMREMIVGKCGIKLLPFAIHALAHGALERFLRPRTDSCLTIGRQITRVDRAERCGNGSSASIGRPVFGCMAIGAISDRSKFCSMIDRFAVRVDRGAGGNRRNGGAPHQRIAAQDNQNSDSHHCQKNTT